MIAVASIWRVVLEEVTGKAGHEVEDGTCTCTGTVACSDLEVIGDGSSEPYFLYFKEINLKRNKYFLIYTCHFKLFSIM